MQGASNAGHKNIDWRLLWPLAIGGGIGGVLGTFVLTSVGGADPVAGLEGQAHTHHPVPTRGLTWTVGALVLILDGYRGFQLLG